MKQLGISLCLLSVLCACSFTSHEINSFDGTFQEALEASKKINKPLLVYNVKDQCGACNFMSKHTLSSSDVINFINKNYVFYKYRTSEGKKYLNQLLCQVSYPAFIVFNPDGEIKSVVSGVNGISDFISYFTYLKTIEYDYAHAIKTSLKAENTKLHKLLNTTNSAYHHLKANKLGKAREQIQKSLNIESYFFNNYLAYQIAIAQKDDKADIFKQTCALFNSPFNYHLYLNELDSIGCKQESSECDEHYNCSSRLIIDDNMFDFGEIKCGEEAIKTFKVRNEGHHPIVITYVESSCDCGKMTWSKEPITKDREGYINVEFDSTTSSTINVILSVYTQTSTEPQHISINGKIRNI